MASAMKIDFHFFCGGTFQKFDFKNILYPTCSCDIQLQYPMEEETSSLTTSSWSDSVSRSFEKRSFNEVVAIVLGIQIN
jgi:hypothetical protein